MLPVLHVRRIMFRTALWQTPGPATIMIAICFSLSLDLCFLCPMTIILPSWLYFWPVGLDGLVPLLFFPLCFCNFWKLRSLASSLFRLWQWNKLPITYEWWGRFSINNLPMSLNSGTALVMLSGPYMQRSITIRRNSILSPYLHPRHCGTSVKKKNAIIS